VLTYAPYRYILIHPCVRFLKFDNGAVSNLLRPSRLFESGTNREITPILHSLITETSLPLKSVEVDFAADSSGFTTSRFARWFDHKYGAVRQQHEWVKVHLMCGVRTNIVTAVEIRDKDASDTKLLPDLVDTTAKNFTISEISADKGYGSVKTTKPFSGTAPCPISHLKAFIQGAPRASGKRCFTTSNFVAMNFWLITTSAAMLNPLFQ
jgi:Transposase DDE domain